MNILIISPFFYPDKGVGALRMSSLSRYLIKKGVKLWILTEKKEIMGTDIKAEYRFVESVRTGNFLTEFIINRNRYLFAFRELSDIEEFDAVIISGGPFYTFPVAIEAKKKNIRCCLDFRDPWVFDIREDFFNIRNLIRQMYYLPYERKAVKAVDDVVTVTDRWVKSFRRYYPTCRSKIHLIENGFDDEQLNGLKRMDYERSAPVTIGVFGKLFYYTDKYSRIFARALKKYTYKISVIQIGEREKQVDEILDQINIEHNIIESTGFMSYKSGMEMLMNADYFLIIDARNDAIGTKIYDYIYLQKPIIYVGPKNTYISEIIIKYQLGYSCKNQQEVEKVLEDLGVSDKKVQINEESRNRFARSFQNEKWWNMLNEK